MLEVKTFGLLPIQAEFVLMTAGGDMRVASGLDVGSYADGGGGRSQTASSRTRSFFE